MRFGCVGYAKLKLLHSTAYKAEHRDVLMSYCL